jgi:hypothetical protein
MGLWDWVYFGALISMGSSSSSSSSSSEAAESVGCGENCLWAHMKRRMKRHSRPRRSRCLCLVHDVSSCGPVLCQCVRACQSNRHLRPSRPSRTPCSVLLLVSVDRVACKKSARSLPGDRQNFPTKPRGHHHRRHPHETL